MINIKPIDINEWLPDRCLSSADPIYIDRIDKKGGCPSLEYYTNGKREILEKIYSDEISMNRNCGFIAWENRQIIGYITYFGIETARKIRFYGYGETQDQNYDSKIMIHNCLSIWKGTTEKGIGSRLIKSVINYGKQEEWDEYRVYNVLPDCEKGKKYHQKGCIGFWNKNGFEILEEKKAEEEIEQYYGVKTKYTVRYVFR